MACQATVAWWRPNDATYVYTMASLTLSLHAHHSYVLTSIPNKAVMIDAGTTESQSAVKNGYKLPRAPMTNSDITRLINSDEIQSVVRPKKDGPRRRPLKKNPLRNLGALLKLNPYAKAARRAALLQEVSGCAGELLGNMTCSWSSAIIADSHALCPTDVT